MYSDDDDDVVELHVLGCRVDIYRDKLSPMPKHGSMSLYVRRNRKARLDGKPRTSTSTFTQLLNSEYTVTKEGNVLPRMNLQKTKTKKSVCVGGWVGGGGERCKYRFA